MNKTKIMVVILLSACFIGGGIILTANMGWFQTKSTPKQWLDIKTIDTILEQVSEDRHEALNKLVSVEGNGQNTYNWKNIEFLLQKDYSEMKIEDYVVLLQVIQGMTELHADSTANTDWEAMEQYIQKGYKAGELTSTTANICNLYMVWVEEVLVLQNSRVLFLGNPQGDDITLRSYFKEEMFKAAVLGVILLNDEDQSQSKRKTKDSPDIKIIGYKQGDSQPQIQIGNTTSTIYRFRPDAYTSIVDVQEIIAKTLKQGVTQEKTKKFLDAADLSCLAYAYSMGGTLSVSENFSVRLVSCFNETELQLRANAYNWAKDQNITIPELKGQIGTKDGSDYVEWWNRDLNVGGIEYKKYQRILKSIYSEYRPTRSEFSAIEFEELTPNQINKLDQKMRPIEKGEEYELDLGDPP